MTEEEAEEGFLRQLRDIRGQLDGLEARLQAAAEAQARPERRPRDGRVSTHVEGIDAMLDGGIPAGHVVLLQGPPGTMKTSLALYVLARSKAEGARCLHLSLEEDRESLRRTMDGLGLDGDDFIVDIATMRAEHGIVEETEDWLGILLSYLERKVREGLDLLAIDPFDALFDMATTPTPPRALFRFFKFLRDAGITTLLICEDGAFPHREDRMADGVLTTRQRELEGGLVALWMRCVKLRHANHSRDFHRLEFRDGTFSARPLLSL